MKIDSGKEAEMQITRKMNSFLEIIWILAKLHLLVAILLDLEITLLLEKSITNLALHHMR